MTAGEPGRLWGVGVGPGDPELLTRKALRLVRAADVVAYHAAAHGRSNARAVVADELRPEQIELPLRYPVTTGAAPPEGYEPAMRAFYDASAAAIAGHLDAGRDVAVLCEGDPLFYGSYMYLHDRLAPRYAAEVVPGVTSILAAAARTGTPLVRRDDPLTVLPGTLPEAVLAAHFARGGAFAVMKLGRTFGHVRRALASAGLLERARYVERATMPGERLAAAADVDETTVPYFSVVLVPGDDVPVAPQPRPGAGSLAVVGLGPAGPDWLAPEARAALAAASDLVGYGPYLDRVPTRPGQRRHPSDNRVEVERARHALELAAGGADVCVVSAGDPGVFAMASAVVEALEAGPAAWAALELRVVPGISAMLAAAARVGAPLGGDFCAISLSDRLKPWDVVERRLEAAAAADFALALYNPISSQRRWQLGAARDVLLRHRAPETPAVLARDVGGPGERVAVVALGELDPEAADMRTLVLVGASTTRLVPRPGCAPLVYTPRFVRVPVA